MQRSLPVLAALVLCALAAIANGSPVITAVSESGTGLAPEGVYFTGQTFDHVVEGAGFTVPFLDEDVPFFTDRNHEYNGYTVTDTLASLNLVGAEYVMPANDNRGVADYQLATTVSQSVDAFVFLDTRMPQPAWLTANGWTFLGQKIGIDEGGDGVGPGVLVNNTMWVWKKAGITPGTFTTYERGGTGNNMYGVAVTAPGTGPTVKEFPGADFVPENFGLIDIGASDGRPEPGALETVGGVAQIGAGASGVNGLNLSTRQMSSDLGDVFTIEIDNVDQTGLPVGGMDWRDRGDSALVDLMPTPMPLVQMAEDFVKNNAGLIHVILGALPAGPYEVTSYHLDPDNAQCEAIGIWVDVGDGAGYVDTGVVGSANVVTGGVGNLTPQGVIDNGVTFGFTADGTHNVMIVFDGTQATDKELPLTGLNIRFVPEPATLALLGLGLGGLLLRRKR